MRLILFPSLRYVVVLFVLLFASNQVFAQPEKEYYSKLDTWEESVRMVCDKLNYDWNHKEGDFKFIFYYEKNWESFNKRVQAELKRTLHDFEDSDASVKLKREIDDKIWETDRKVGDYKPLAVKMAWKIKQDYKKQAVDLANQVENWNDFQKIRELYHLDEDLTILKMKLDREFNPTNLYKGIDYLASVNNWDQAHLTEIKSKIQIYEKQKIELQDKYQRAELNSVKELEEFLAETAAYLRGIFVTNNKLVNAESLIFLKRFAFQSNHYYTDYVNGCKYYGGNLFTLNLKTGETKELIPELQNGIINRFDLDFDAGKIVFDWKEEQQSGFRIYEKNLESGELKTLTTPPDNEDELIKSYRVTKEYHHGTDDMHPIYLPDGKICFISSRCQFGILCDAPDNFSTTVLYRMNGDGSGMEKLTNSSLSESNPSVMNDGRILYTRWEYVDKGAVSVKCLWAMRPDGTNPVEIFGNTLSLPPTLLMGRQIPGHSNLFSCLGTPHCCPQNGVGTVLKIDTNEDSRTAAPMTYITPNTDVRSEHGITHFYEGDWHRTDAGPVYCDPYPLSDKMYLVSHNPSSYFNKKDAWELYLIDDFGNHIPIYSDPDISCWQPLPFTKREKPPVVNSSINPELKEQGLAAVFITDVNRGMEGIEKGEAKYIRVNEQVPRPWKARKYWENDDYDQQHAVITKDTHLGLKVQHGIVPLEEDGSASFLVPADKNIFFQVLDENFMELQRERTYNNFRPGETRSCIGCHERQNEAAFNNHGIPMAFKKKPQLPQAQPGEKSGLRPIDYMTDVQPVWDKHCINCHSGESPKGDLNLSGELTTFFCKSYENLVAERRARRKNDPNYLGMIIGENHPKEQNVHYLPAKSLGSRTSTLMTMIRKGHSDVKLSQEELIKISTWIDSNAQFYGTYFGKKNLKYKDDKDFRPIPTISSGLAEQH